MISGFNQDVEFEGVVYHVQTEDKGLKSKLIVSLVYDGGTILASKRTSYEDLASADFDEAVLAEKVQRQHQLICAAVRGGRLNDLKEMSAKGRQSVPARAPEPVTPIIPMPAAPVEMPQVQVVAVAEISTASSADVNGSYNDLLPPPPLPYTPTIAVETIPVYEIFDDTPMVDGVSIVEEESMFPDEAVAVVSELSGVERPTNTKLSIELLGDSKFRGGERRTVNIMICRGTERKVIKNAEIMIKVLGSSFRPLIFHAKSDSNGLAKVHMQLPHFEAGRAAVLIRAKNNGDETELRRIMTPG